MWNVESDVFCCEARSYHVGAPVVNNPVPLPDCFEGADELFLNSSNLIEMEVLKLQSAASTHVHQFSVSQRRPTRVVTRTECQKDQTTIYTRRGARLLLSDYYDKIASSHYC